MRRFLSVLAVVFAAACTRNESDGEVVLRFVSWKPTQPRVWERAIRNFEETHPGIRVEREIGPHSSTAFHDLLTQKLKNRDAGVDVYFIDVIWTAEFAAAGWALRLDERFPSDERAQFLDAPVRAATWNGSVWAVPAFVDVGVLYYRKDLLEAADVPVPETWPELARAAGTVVEGRREADPGLVGYTAQFKQYEGLVCGMLEFIASNGGALIDLEAGRSTLSTPASVEAVEWVRDRVIGGIAPRSVLTYEEPESLALFLQGEAVFHRNWPYAWEVINDPEHSRIAGRAGIASLPGFEPGSGRSALGGWFYGVSAFSEHPDEAWALVEHFSSESMQRTFALEASLAPTRRALYGDPDVLQRNPRFDDQARAFRRAVPRPTTPVYPAVSEVLQRYFSRAIADPNSDVPALAREADREVNRLLEMVR